MVGVKDKRAFSEVNAFLEIIEEENKNKIPIKLRELIKEQKLDEYNPKYNPDIPMEDQNISKEALSIIALLDLNYWCESEEEKQMLRDIFSQNEKVHQEELSKVYKDNIFNNEAENKKENVALVEYTKTSIVKRIIEKIKHFLGIKMEGL